VGASGPVGDADSTKNSGNAQLDEQPLDEQPAEGSGSRLTRRRLLERGGTAVGAIAGLGIAGFVGFKLPHHSALAATRPATAAAAPKSPYDPGAVVRHFVTRGDLTPPAISVTSVGSGTPATSPGYIFLSTKGYPAAGPGQAGNIILDRQGRVVWFAPSGSQSWLGFDTQTYRGQPVLTWWQGDVKAGYGKGEGVIADASYKTIATVRAGHGLMADLHEFAITPQDTALVTAYRPAPADLSKLGGKARGMVLSGVVQEIDIATGRVLFEWDSLDHVPPAETMAPFAGGTSKLPFDYFHINSIAIAPDGDLLVSSRNTCAVYKISRPGGQVVWRLGGRQSSFTMGPGTRFYFQHHARPHGASTLSLFDDGGAPPQIEKQSRAILLDLDTAAMTATLRRQYLHPAGVAAANQGSMQVLPDGRVFVGWGNQPYFSEFAADGQIRLEGEFPVSDQSYRAFTAAWHGRPDGRPATVAQVNPAGGSVVYVSWNGATEVAGWVVRGGPAPDSLSQVGRQEWLGFETAIAVASSGPYFAVTAVDAHGKSLGDSEAVKVGNA
jgi:hypothetical protein